MYILLEKAGSKPLEMGENLETLCEKLEYGDVKEGEYEVWLYPSGEVHTLEVDRKVDNRYFYLYPIQRKRSNMVAET